MIRGTKRSIPFPLRPQDMSRGRRLMSSKWSSNPPSSLEKLLALNKISTETFVNASELFVPYRGRGLFGGTMVAQSLLASLLHSNMPEKKWKPVSIHCHFLQAVQPTPQLQYKVTTLKPGKNYLTKEVNLHQNNKLVFKAIVTLQAYKLQGSASNLKGQLNHHRKAPVVGVDIAPPEKMFSQSELIPNSTAVKCYEREPCDWRLPKDLFDLSIVKEEEKAAPVEDRVLRYWVKNKEPLQDPSVYNWVSLAYVSDYFYLSANMRLNMREMFTTKFSVSLDHTIYFNTELNTSEFFNYNVRNIKAGENKSIMMGEIFNREGKLGATTFQEGLSVINP